jgi:hypothetical protein
MDPGDGTLVPVEVLGRSQWPGTWRVRLEDGTTKLTDRLIDNKGQVMRP